MGKIKYILFWGILVSFISCKTGESSSHKPEKPLVLFNGKDLNNWKPDVPHLDANPNAQTPFFIRNGYLVSLGNFKGTLVSEQEYQNYHLEVEYRFVKPGNCGVLVFVSAPRTLNNLWPKSIEVQMMHENAGDFWCIGEDISVPDMEKRRGPQAEWSTMNRTGRRILNLTDNSEKPVGEWNTLTVECLANEVKVWVNTDLVNHGTNATASKGKIALQSEGAEVEFRKVELRPITKLGL